MRQIGTFSQRREAEAFSQLLSEDNIFGEIEERLEQQKTVFIFWVFEEDRVQQAKHYLEIFRRDPNKIKQQTIRRKQRQKEEDNPLSHESTQCADHPEIDELRPGRTMRHALVSTRATAMKIRFRAIWTKLLIATCIVIYGVSMFQRLDIAKTASPSFFFPLTTPIQSTLLYDDPQAMRFNQKLALNYHYTTMAELQNLPQEAQKLVKGIETHPVWPGAYDLLVDWIQHKEIPRTQLFGSFLHGEIWRAVTPIFLHGDLLHIIFNLLWLWMLGKVVEARMRVGKYLLFIVIVAVMSNTLQYLMSGPLFMGFSGVICGMAGFIWMRQTILPNEVYPIHKAMLVFLGVFILAMVLLQLIAFFLQIFNIVDLQLRIANTAHVSGAVTGILLAKLL